MSGFYVRPLRQCEPAREPAILAREPAIPAREPAISAREPGSQNNCFGECLLSDCECILAILEGAILEPEVSGLYEQPLYRPLILFLVRT